MGTQPRRGALMDYDNGGQLPPGIHPLVNDGDPEPVLTADQWTDHGRRYTQDN